MSVDLDYASHFEEFLFDWNHKTYLAIGSYGSGKSHETAIKIIVKLLEEKRRCAVIREVYETHTDSTYELLQEVAGVIDPDGELIKFKKSPLSVEFYNGSKIIFKGLDIVEKMKGLQGVSIVWIEEASEIKYAGYKELILRLRTKKQSLHIILSTNPVSEENWVFTHFFIDYEKEKVHLKPEIMYEQRTVKMDDLFIHHSTVDDNPFVPETYVKELDKMKDYDPELYMVARKGHFGVLGEKVLNNLEFWEHEEVEKAIKSIQNPLYKNGMDFGFSDSYNAISNMVVDHDKKWLYVYDEYYTKGKSDPEIAKDMEEKGLKKVIIKGDNAESKTIFYLQQKGFRMLPCVKLTRVEQVKKMKRFEKIIISNNCKNHKRELRSLTNKTDKNGKVIPGEFNIDAHTFSSMWYGLDDYDVATKKGYNAKKF